MSPLDDELRAALHGRATVVPPSADPLAGIERRAARMRRNRVAASVAGTVLAVAAVASAVPLLQAAVAPGPDVPRVASAPPTVLPSTPPSPAGSPPPVSYVLDPATPWEPRGLPAQELGEGTLETVRRELATARGVPPASVALSPLFGQRYEPSGQVELVYVAQVDGAARWGVARATESGPELAVDEPLAAGSTALVAALPGDEVPRLLVVAAPEAGAIEYGPDDASEYAPMARLADGVATGPLEGDPATDTVRVLDPQDREVFRGPAPDLAGPPSAGGEPDNLLGWPERLLAPDDGLLERAAAGYATAKGVSRSQVQYRPLFSGDNDPGQAYAVLQAWVDGQRAQVFGWIETPGREPEAQLRPLTDPGTPLVALLLTEIPGRTTDELVLVPQPGTGEVLYRSGPGAELRPVTVDGLDGIALVDRAPGAEGDEVVLLDGDGDLDAPTAEVPVRELLCGEKGCG